MLDTGGLGLESGDSWGRPPWCGVGRDGCGEKESHPALTNRTTQHISVLNAGDKSVHTGHAQFESRSSC